MLDIIVGQVERLMGRRSPFRDTASAFACKRIHADYVRIEKRRWIMSNSAEKLCVLLHSAKSHVVRLVWSGMTVALLFGLNACATGSTSDGDPKQAAIMATERMVSIPAGTFLMGSPESEAERRNDEPQHEVTISNDFLMSRYEVTVGEFRRFVTVSGYQTEAETGGDVVMEDAWEKYADDHPVVLVSWNDAVAYCNWLSKEEGLPPAYTISGDTVTWNREANGYRLPTEAEWEYACRAGTVTPFSTGNNITTSEANYNGNYPYNGNAKGIYRKWMTAVGSFAANPWGLYDMHGNVWEWCWDWFGDYSSDSETDPAGAASGVFRVIRGGSWSNDGQFVRSAYRYCNIPVFRYYNYGFRLVRSL